MDSLTTDWVSCCCRAALGTYKKIVISKAECEDGFKKQHILRLIYLLPIFKKQCSIHEMLFLKEEIPNNNIATFAFYSCI